MKKILFIAAFGVLLAGCNQAVSDQSTDPNATPTVDETADMRLQAEQGLDDAEDSLAMNAQVRTITLLEQNESGQSGTAVLTELDDSSVVVVLNLMGGELTAAQPAHIHVGSCATLGAVQYPLSNVVDGSSETTLDMTMEELIASSETLAINVHKSAAESSVYTACGDLK